jgi:hypothetical protein
MNERDEAEARAVLAELTCLRIDAEPEAMEIAVLLRFAARAKAEALRDALKAIEPFRAEWEADPDAIAEVLEKMAAKLEEPT